jgi:hypothetical protein
LHARLGELFVRSEPRRQAGLYLEGLLRAVERKNGWQLAEHLGEPDRGGRNGCSRTCNGTKRPRAICVEGMCSRPWPIGKQC